MPAYTTSGSDAATATAPTEASGLPSKTHDHERPSSVVFHTPPLAAPTHLTAGLSSTTAREVMRPPIVAGPMPRATTPGVGSGGVRRARGAAPNAARAREQ